MSQPIQNNLLIYNKKILISQESNIFFPKVCFIEYKNEIRNSLLSLNSDI